MSIANAGNRRGEKQKGSHARCPFIKRILESDAPNFEAGAPEFSSP
ncbi:MAG: hypothetical protein ACR2LC_04300 [Pyrinomonadaceae bacterium]